MGMQIRYYIAKLYAPIEYSILRRTAIFMDCLRHGFAGNPFHNQIIKSSIGKELYHVRKPRMLELHKKRRFLKELRIHLAIFLIGKAFCGNSLNSNQIAMIFRITR